MLVLLFPDPTFLMNTWHIHALCQALLRKVIQWGVQLTSGHKCFRDGDDILYFRVLKIYHRYWKQHTGTSTCWEVSEVTFAHRNSWPGGHI